ncbi:MAG: hypothetical protein ACRELY_03075 [Polyangiaceae bacterium]
MHNRKTSEAAERFAERRRRENEAPRLKTEFPSLQTLALEIRETSGAAASAATPMHIRRIMVEHAPALFVMPCGDARCQHGGHDITSILRSHLRSNETRFEGDHECRGSTDDAMCSRVLHFVATATYA